MPKYLLCSLAILAAICAPAQSNDIHVEGRALIKDGKPIIPWGTLHVGKAHFPRLAELGFNALALDLAFWNFDPQKLESMNEEDIRKALLLDTLDAAYDNGMVVLVLFSFHYTPGWLFQRYPDAHLTKYDGSPGGAGWIDMCLDHPDFRRVAKQWLAFATSRLKDHPALLGYILWNEPHLSADYCYSPWTISKFHTWLRDKYDSIESLNAAWGTTYTTFEQVQAPPPRHAIQTFATYDQAVEGNIEETEKADTSGLPLADNSIAWTDWMRFRQHNYAEFFHWETDVIKATDPQHPVTSKIVPFDLYSSHAYSAANDTARFEFLDALGFDTYSHLDEDFNNRWKTDFFGQMAGNRPAWNTELNFTFTEQRGVGSAATWRTTVWQEIGRAINGFWFFHWGGGTTTWSLVYSSGQLNPAGREISRLAPKVAKLAPLLSQAHRPPAQVAFLHSMATSFHNPGDYTCGADATTFLQALYRLHIPYDFVTEEQILTGALDRYRALCLIGTINISDEVLERIHQFIQQGGHVIANTRFAEADEYGRPREAHPPSWFGVKAIESHRQPREEVGTLQLRRQAVDYKGQKLDVHVTQTMYSSRPMQVVAASPHLGLEEGATITSGRFYGNEDMQQQWTAQGRHEETWEQLLSTGGRVVAAFADGQPAVVTTDRTVYIGRDTCWLSEEWIRLVASFAKNAGVTRIAYARDRAGQERGDVDLAILETPQKRILFITRFPLTLVDDGLQPRPDRPVPVYVGCRGGGEFVNLLADRPLYTRDAGDYRQTVVALRPGDARVLMLQK